MSRRHPVAIGPGAGRKLSRKGANTSTPTASPVHHTDQVDRKPPGGIPLETSRVSAPPVADSAMLGSAATNTRATASRSRARSVRKSSRFSSTTATSGASVFPTVMPAATSSEGLRGAFTAKAPSATPGHIRGPSNSSTTTAIPVGGQMGVTCPLTSARCRLRRADS